MKKSLTLLFFIYGCIAIVSGKKGPEIAPSYAWRIMQPLGERYRVPMDTAMLNFYQTDLPSFYSIANGFTGNLGAANFSKIFFDRNESQEFIFMNPYLHWYYTPDRFDFYNTRIPFTQVSYLTGGSKANAQDHLKGIFSGNVNKKLAFGAGLDLIYARGFYDRQAVKNLSYQLFGSYIGDKYELQVYLNTANFLSQENGGIKDDNYILRPDDNGSFGDKTIPVNLNHANNRIRGKIYYATQRYNLGFERTETKDTVEETVFVPVTSFIHTIQYTDNRRRFFDGDASDEEFFQNHYFSDRETNDTTSWWSIKNTLGISLREGFNKYAKLGLAAYLTYEHRRFTIMSEPLPEALKRLYDNAPTESFEYEGHLFPARSLMMTPRRFNENLLWVGAELSKTQGKILTYRADGKLGLTGPEAGAIDINGDIRTRFRLFGDTIQLKAYGYFKNTAPSFYYRHYSSNHFYWNNDFGKVRRFRIGGEFSAPRWGTRLNIGVENLQNYVYFNSAGLPVQEGSIIQVFSAILDQKFRVGILNWDNELAYQKTSNSSVIPLPEFSVSSNLYLLFRLFDVLHIQFGVDCHYYTRYYSEAYQPATQSFHVQDKIKIGNYPLMDVYANMRLKKVRFYVMLSHVNQGLFGGNNYFSLPHYPLNPRIFQFGLSVDFAN